MLIFYIRFLFTNYIAWHNSEYSYLLKNMPAWHLFKCLPEIQKAVLELINFIYFPTFLLIMALMSLIAVSTVWKNNAI